MSEELALPVELAREPLPVVLLPYQQQFIRAVAESDVVVWEKSRRIGASWAVAAFAVLTAGASAAAQGRRVMYIGYNEDMTREFIEICGMWASAFDVAAGESKERLINDGEKDILTLRIRFASGYSVLALSSRPRNIRGKQGVVIIDEAAFHGDFLALLKAATPLLIWGGSVVVLSSHDGEMNQFNQLVTDIRAGRKPYRLLRTTFADALADGLYKRICLCDGKVWTPEGERAWEAKIRSEQADPDQELDCIPTPGTGTVLPGTLIEARQDPTIPVLRYVCPDKWAERPSADRQQHARAWWDAHVAPVLRTMSANLPTYCGIDFGRKIDLTVIWPLQVLANMLRRPPFVIELRSVPWEQQRNILWWTLDLLPHLNGGAADGAGIGAVLAEETCQRYGLSAWTLVGIDQAWLAWYRDHMPRLIAAFEDDMTRVPRDRDIYDDHRQLQRVGGIIQPRKVRTSDATGERHADSAIAHALAFVSSALRKIEYGYASARTRAAEAVHDYRRPHNIDLPPGAKSRAGSGIRRLVGAL